MARRSGQGAKKGAGTAAGGVGAKRPTKVTGPARKGSRAATPATAPAPAPKKLPKKKVQRILDDIHHVLTSHDVSQPVKLHFTAAAAGPCYEYRLITDENGDSVYRMVEVPCPGA